MIQEHFVVTYKYIQFLFSMLQAYIETSFLSNQSKTSE